MAINNKVKVILILCIATLLATGWILISHLTSLAISNGYESTDEIYNAKLNNNSFTFQADVESSIVNSYQWFVTNGYCIVRDVVETDGGDYLVVGTRGAAYQPLRACMMKVKKNGEIEWIRSYGGEMDNVFQSIQKTNDGYIVSGATKSFGSGDYDFWVVKLFNNENVDVDWSQTYGGNGLDYARSVIQTTAGYIVVGYTESFGAGGIDIWVLKLDSDGTPLIEQTFGTGGDLIGNAVYQTEDGSIIVTGYDWDKGLTIKLKEESGEFQYEWGTMLDDVFFFPYSPNHIVELDNEIIVVGSTYVINRDAAIVRFDSESGIVNHSSIVTSGTDEKFQTIYKASDGGYIAGGDYIPVYGQPNRGWFVKFKSDHQIEWQKYISDFVTVHGVSSVIPTMDYGYVAAIYNGILKVDTRGDIHSCSYLSDSHATIIDTPVLTSSLDIGVNIFTNIIESNTYTQTISGLNAGNDHVLLCGSESFNISGCVKEPDETPIPDVTLSTPGGISATTNNTGTYTLTNLITGTYEVVPIKSGYSFSPYTRTITVPPSATDQDFVGTPCSADQWNVEFFTNRDLQGNPTLTRCDSAIDFYWGESSPDPLLTKDNFSAKWHRTVDFSKSGWYRFRTFTDDGLRLYIDDDLVIDDWVARSFDEMSETVYLEQGAHHIRMEYVEWSDDSMAYLNWYLCPNGEGDCDLNITPQYQTKHLDQPMSADCTSVANQTLARWGCLVTSLSMNMQAFQINTNPADLNQWLTDNDYYLDPDNDGCNGGINQYTMEAIRHFANSQEDPVQLDWHPISTISDASNAIRDNYPVIMQVAGGGHWTLAVDVLSNNGVTSLGINDPHHSYMCDVITATTPLPPTSELSCSIGTLRHATTVGEENSYRGSAIPFGYLKPLEPDQSRTPSLALAVSGAEVLLTDDEGRSAGYDQPTDTFLFGIPNSFYFNPVIVPFGDEPSGLLERLLYISRDAIGSFNLKIIDSKNQAIAESSSNQYYTVELVGFDEEFNRTESTITGTIGDYKNYQIDFTPGQPIEITSILNIYLPLTTR